MADPKQPGQLLPLIPEGVPALLKSAPRWAPWCAVWRERRGKYDKVPAWGLSTARPEKWRRFDAALASLQAAPGTFTGLGYVMTGPHGLVALDLDNCVDHGTPAAWALAIVRSMGSYTEISPSGKGLRIFVRGQIAHDWNNHDIGIEVYAGHAARFLTVTGQHLAGAPREVNPVEDSVLVALSDRYAKVRELAPVVQLRVPDLIDPLALPDLAAAGVSYRTREFLSGAEVVGDRSRVLFAAAVDLAGAGLSEAEALSVLVESPTAFGIALDHRRQDYERALRYLWDEHVQKGKARAGSSRVASADDFDDVSSPASTPPGALTAQAQAAGGKARRFNIQHCSEFAAGAPVRWAIKRLLPYAELGAIIGESGAGKSFFVLDMIFCLAGGRPWRGVAVAPTPVLYICAEGAAGFRARLHAYAAFHGVDLATLPIYVLGDAPNLMEKDDIKELLAAMSDIPQVGLVVADTLAQMTPGANENSGEDMGRALGHCKALHRKLAAMVLLVAHAGKDLARGLRGWSGIKAALDVQITVEKAGKYHAATVTKLKDGQGEGDEHGFELRSVVVGQDEDGEDITSCVVVPTQPVPKAARKAEVKGDNEKILLRLAVDMTDLAGPITSNELIEAGVREKAAPEPGKKDGRRWNMQRALDALVAANQISVAGGTVRVL